MITFFRITFTSYRDVLTIIFLGVLLSILGFTQYLFATGLEEGLSSIDLGSGVGVGGSGDILFTGIDSVVSTSSIVDNFTTGIIDVDSSTSGSASIGSTASTSGILVYTTGSLPQYGDLQIVEVFPSSGNCLDEYIIIHSFINYSGWITIWGLGSSTGSIQVYVDLKSGDNLLIADSMAGMIPYSQTILVSSITLTNGGERLQIIISGVLVDDIVYSNLQSIHSLFFTSLSGTQRLFTTNGAPTPSTTCAIGPPLVGAAPGGVGLCDIEISSLNYQSTGVYILTAKVSGSMVSSCQTDGIIYSGSWSINGFSQDVGHCQTSFMTQLGVNTIIFSLMSGSQKICYDQFIFAAHYDVYTVKQQVSTPGGSCQTGKPNSTSNSIIIYPSTDCGISLQGTYPLGLFITNSFNFIVSYKDMLLSDSQTVYQCNIDLGDGTVIEECNPTSYKFTKPGVHKLSVSIYNRSDRQLICTTRTFVNVPINKLGVNLLARSGELFTGFDTPSSGFTTGILLQNNTISDGIDDENKGGLDSGSGCQSIPSLLPFTIDSVLPNPIGSDALGEEIIFKIHTGYSSYSLDLSAYYLMIGKKKHLLSGLLSDQRLSQKQGRGLNNNGSCLILSHRHCLQIQRFCYNKVKEGEWVKFDDQDNVLVSGVLSQTGILLENHTTGGILSDNSSKKSSKKDANTLSCTEKISLAKAKQKTSFDKKYNKLKHSYQLYKEKTLQQLDEWKTKELLARNKRYLYKNIWGIISKNITTSRGSLAEQLSISWYTQRAKYLESQISSGYIYTNKVYTRKNISYTYTNDIAKDIKQQQKISLIYTLFPDITDYINHLRSHQINYTLIEKLKKQQLRKSVIKK